MERNILPIQPRPPFYPRLVMHDFKGKGAKRAAADAAETEPEHKTSKKNPKAKAQPKKGANKGK